MSKKITINGETATKSEWAKRLNVSRCAIHYREKHFGESAELAVKHFYYKNVVDRVTAEVATNLRFYNDSYVKASLKSLSYALPQMVGEVDGVGRILGRVIADLEEVVRITDLHIKQLETKSKEGE